MDDNDELMHVNPCPPSWLSEEQKAVLRGDTIADSVYSERWLIATLKSLFEAIQTLPPLNCPEKNTDGSDLLSCQSEAANTAKNNTVVVDALPEKLEECASQLWDMCVDRDVALHVLQLNDGIVLYMLYTVLGNPSSIRLTEILCGIVVNLCCQPEGCKAVLSQPSLAAAVASLPERCTHSLVLLQIFSLLDKLLYHCRYRSLYDAESQSSRTSDENSVAKAENNALAVALHNSSLEHFLAFILCHNFNEELINCTLSLLKKLLYFKDPDENKTMAKFYENTGLVSALVQQIVAWHQNVTSHHSRSFEEQQMDEFEAKLVTCRDEAITLSPNDNIHKLILCLFAFVDTSGADVIVSSSDRDVPLEAALVHYISLMASYVESELSIHKSHKNLDINCFSQQLCFNAEFVGSAVRILELLVRSIGQPEVILPLGRLLALLDYSGICCDDPQVSSPQPEPVINPFSVAACASTRRRTKSSSCALSANTERPESSCKRTSLLLDDEVLYDITKVKDYRMVSCLEPATFDELLYLRMFLEKYFSSVLGYWTRFGDLSLEDGGLCRLLCVLEQCHASELLLVLNALKRFDIELVPKLQEVLLDHKAYPRIVALLAKLYQ